MEKRRIISPEVGKTYENKNGETFKCINYEGKTSVLQNVKTGWTMRCHGVGQYENGSIDWDYSSGGYFADFDIGIISRTSYEERGYGYKVRITVFNIKLNGQAMNDWIMSGTVNIREVYETQEEWERHKEKVAKIREEWERKIADILGIRKTDRNSISYSQAVSEIFTVVYMEDLTA